MSAFFGIDEHNAETFLKEGYVCIDKAVAIEDRVLNTFRSIKTEDVVFIKRFNPHLGLHVTAAGLILSDYPAEIDLDICIPVEWVWQGSKDISEMDEKCLYCGDLLYEEHNILVQKELASLMPDRLHLSDEWQ